MKETKVNGEQAEFAGKYSIHVNDSLIYEDLRHWSEVERHLDQTDAGSDVTVEVKENTDYEMPACWIQVRGVKSDKLADEGLRQLARVQEESADRHNVELQVSDHRADGSADTDPFSEPVPHLIDEAVAEVYDELQHRTDISDVEVAEHLRTLARRYERSGSKARQPAETGEVAIRSQRAGEKLTEASEEI